jgi:hypothetical protein
MGRRRAGVLAAVVAAAGLLLVPVAQAQSSTTVTPTGETWYQADPTCTSELGCLSGTTLPPPAPPITLPPLDVYPEGTMHVAASGGAETARSYIALPLIKITGEVTGGRLVVPLDVSPDSGSALPETAQIQVCPYFGQLAEDDGTTLPPPETLCGNGVPATYVGTPSPRFEAELAALAAVLTGADGLALLPVVSEQSTWHVAFSAHDRPKTASTTAPASVTVQLASAAPDVTAPEEPVAAPEDVVPPSDLEAVPDLGTGSGTPSLGEPLEPSTAPPPPAAPAVAAPADADPAARATRPAAQLLRRPLGAAYPVMWILPIVLFLAVPWIGRLLMTDLSGRRTSTA